MLKLELICREKWLELASNFSDYNYEQFLDYNLMCAKKHNAYVESIVITSNNVPIGLANVRIKMIPFSKFGIAYISGGPLILGNLNTDLETSITSVLNLLKEEYVKKRKLVLRVRPELNDVRKHNLHSILLKTEFRPSKEVTEILVKEISDNIDNIRMSLTRKWRKELTWCQRHYPNLDVRIGSEAALFEDFSKLYQEFLTIKKTGVNLDGIFYENLQSISSVQEKLTAIIIYYNNIPISGQISSFCKSTCNGLLGANNEAAREINASYLTQWVTIKYAKEQGCNLYNTWGIDRVTNESVYYFKSGLNGEIISYPIHYQCTQNEKVELFIIVSEKIYSAFSKTVKKARGLCFLL